MTKFTTTTAILSAVLSLATFSAASAGGGRDTSANGGARRAVAVQAPVVEGRNAAVVVDSAIAANAERAISEAVRQVRR